MAEGALPERDCRIVRLLEAGFTQQEIAEELGLTQQAVSFRVGQIRKKLQKIEATGDRPQESGKLVKKKA